MSRQTAPEFDRRRDLIELLLPIASTASPNRKGGSRTMEARLNVITLAVDDLERALVFYRDGLGLQTKGVVANDLVDEETGAAGAIVIFKLESGLLLTLYPRPELAKDAAVPAGPPQSGQFSLGQLVGSRADVDRILEQAAAAGAVVTPPHDRPWGIYSGYFRDPDGHLWEIIWNPDRTSDSD
jgi:catechol 2,3-dioxygenase-like lactoylglutathione lyase family enzyme